MLQDYIHAVADAEARVERLVTQIEELLPNWSMRPVVEAVQAWCRTVPIDPTKLPVMERVAKEWFARLTSEFGSLLEHREKFLVSAPAVMAALGAVGHPLVAIEDDAARRAKANELISMLKPVDWQRGERWAGIAGKLSTRGQLSVGGAKETAYAVYSALSDPSQESYREVRT